MTDPKFEFDTGGASDKGCIREQNEDRFLTKPSSGVWVVADGMGGHEAGDYASQTIVDSVGSIGFPASAPDLQARFVERIERAHEDIQARSRELNGATVGATLVAVLAFEENFACIWSGDSRIYLLRDDEMRQVSTDHTEAQELLAAGSITPEEAENWPRKNVITRAIGVSSKPRLDEIYGVLRPDDVFLLCSDGLTEHVEDHEIDDAMRLGDAQKTCDDLIQMTLDRGARDNVTVVVVRCLSQNPTETEAESDTQSTRQTTEIDWSIGT